MCKIILMMLPCGELHQLLVYFIIHFDQYLISLLSIGMVSSKHIQTRWMGQRSLLSVRLFLETLFCMHLALSIVL